MNNREKRDIEWFSYKISNIKRSMNILFGEMISKYRRLRKSSKDVVHIKRKDLENLLIFRSIAKESTNRKYTMQSIAKLVTLGKITSIEELTEICFGKDLDNTTKINPDSINLLFSVSRNEMLK